MGISDGALGKRVVERGGRMSHLEEQDDSF